MLTGIVALIVAAVVLMIVSRLNLGLKVDGFGAAIIGAVAIAVVGWVLNWLLGLIGLDPMMGQGLIGAIVYVLVAAVVLVFAGRVYKGLQVSGYTGAIIAAIGIGVVTWILAWLLGLLGITF